MASEWQATIHRRPGDCRSDSGLTDANANWFGRWLNGGGRESHGSGVTVVVSVRSVRGLGVLFALQLVDLGGVRPHAGRRAPLEEVGHVSYLRKHRKCCRSNCSALPSAAINQSEDRK